MGDSKDTRTIPSDLYDRTIKVLERVEDHLRGGQPCALLTVRELRKALQYPTPEARVEALLREARSRESDLFNAISGPDLSALAFVLDKARTSRRFEFPELTPKGGAA